MNDVGRPIGSYTDVPEILRLTDARDRAASDYFSHLDPGGLRPADKQAWCLEDQALLLLLRAAQIRLNGEITLQRLLAKAQETSGA